MAENDFDALISEIEVIEAQPLHERARGFEGLYEKLLSDLKRSDSHDES